MSYPNSPSSRAEARQFGADALEGYRSRRASRGIIGLETLVVAGTAGLFLHVVTGLSGATAIAIGILIFIAGNLLFALPVVGVLASVGISLFWGSIAFNLLSGYGNVFFGIVGAAVVGALSLGLHLGVRR